MTEAKAIRNSVEGRDVPRGPSATQLHERTNHARLLCACGRYVYTELRRGTAVFPERCDCGRPVTA